MVHRAKNLLKRIVLVMLLCALATTLLAAHAGSTQGNPLPESAAPGPGEMVGIAQACYTIDTSRPEWLGLRVYLPIVLKAYTPSALTTQEARP
jgi:hypothetical protein